LHHMSSFRRDSFEGYLDSTARDNEGLESALGTNTERHENA